MIFKLGTYFIKSFLGSDIISPFSTSLHFIKISKRLTTYKNGAFIDRPTKAHKSPQKESPKSSRFQDLRGDFKGTSFLTSTVNSGVYGVVEIFVFIVYPPTSINKILYTYLLIHCFKHEKFQ